MIKRSVMELINMIDVQNDCASFADTLITGVSFNTRTIEKGNLFIPLKGETRDGHEFVQLAFNQGAAVSLWQRDVPNPPKNVPLLIVEDTLVAMQQLAQSYRKELSLKVVAVTGSNGKTTTKDMLAELLSLKYKVQKTSGNFNNHLGLPLTILGLEDDTEVAVLEMGMNHFGEIDLLTNIANPDAAVITNIGDAHLQELGSREGIAKAKMEILNGLKSNGLFVFPGEEPLITNALKNIPNNWKVRTFGKHDSNDVYPTSLKMTESGSVFEINESNDIFQMPVLGEYNVMNALAAMLVASEWGVPFEQMNKAFANLKLTTMRMEMSDGINGSHVLNDAYNASPTSMKAVIELVSSLEGYTKKIVVLGDMLELGPNEAEYHLEIGSYLNPETIDLVYTYGELGKLIAKAAEENFGSARVFAFENKNELISHLKSHLVNNALVVVKASRGMKLEEVVQSITE
ncbi:UDP-N-acetylmuramoyl-tripeptide--D-alanyl-D-alanine ligase [Caldibacillus lycopersici]|uniref:UDP-N-acetylmuramoyl-tripeptide--D-alanyl-D-alanine ligase n=1 Tax=Perspicuibacillus lycopersici TaxID=1325689 RepID=A0AAE3IVU6_9BACI|nr:UDP-N-acetylmuramoyl-tripeptide--D-alanyl-D-alanine ligase [Perspicuibacillus lycopersici]MCU9615152.1 UDP-N-acetylmuramoyl-tripeptide--D-alanyl-D-alanine ligase [Perspicuibacillus lycopersici]